MKKPKPGPLATPLRIKLRPATEAHVLFGLWTKEQAHRHEWLERFRIFAEKRSKLDLLFEHYGISKSGVAGEDYRELALRLAEEFLDGFKVEEVTIDERDQRQVERSARITRLLLDVDSVREHERQNGRECTDPEAID
ncbi:MAG: hypothetical protein PSV22_19370, partial [Pseudolabrys sp.]|nr:hypothetical protein [Pseudolabrys sp.]